MLSDWRLAVHIAELEKALLARDAVIVSLATSLKIVQGNVLMRERFYQA